MAVGATPQPAAAGPAAPAPAAAAAAANAKATAAAAAAARRDRKGFMWLISSLGIFAMLAIGMGSPSLLLFMIVGLGPTIGAVLVDKDPEKHLAIAVGAMSLAAMIPLVLGQFTARPGSGYNVLFDPFAWLTVYGAASIGWGIHAAVPAISVSITEFRTDWRKRDLKKQQDDLVEEWGPEVQPKKKS
jgi:hypothetical protein